MGNVFTHMHVRSTSSIVPQELSTLFSETGSQAGGESVSETSFGKRQNLSWDPQRSWVWWRVSLALLQ